MDNYEILKHISVSENPQALREILNACSKREYELDKSVFSSVKVGDRVMNRACLHSNDYGIVLKKWRGALAFDVQLFNADGTPKDWMGLPDSVSINRHHKARYYVKV